MNTGQRPLLLTETLALLPSRLRSDDNRSLPLRGRPAGIDVFDFRVLHRSHPCQ